MSSQSLLNHMREGLGPIVIASAILTFGCSGPAIDTCPELDALVHRNPVVDAKTAFEAGDPRFLSLGGFVATIPGVALNRAEVRQIAHTTDVETAACRTYRPSVNRYALTYNQTMMSLTGVSKEDGKY